MQRCVPPRSAVRRALRARATWIAAIALAFLPGLPASGAAEPYFSAYSTAYATPAGSRAVAIGDLNADGRLDVVTANGVGTISVLLGLGDGALQGHNDYPTGGSPGEITLKDFDSDGRLDVAAVNAEGTFSILLSNQDGSLRPAIQFANAGWRIGDVNGDGRPDLVALKDTTVWVRLGVGDGTFTPTMDSSIGLRASLATIGDLNRDGRVDLVTWKQDSLLVLLGNGDGSFAPKSAVLMVDPDRDESVKSLMLGDVNGDGVLDMAFTVRGECFRGDCDGRLSVVLGIGDGTFGQAWASVGGDPFGLVTIADVDGNGRTDVVSWNNGGMHVLANRLDGVVEPRRVPIYAATLAIGDLNGDTRPDIVTVYGGSAVSVAIGNGDLTFGSGFERLLTFSPASVASGDLNGDGRADLVAAHETSFENPNRYVTVLLDDQGGGLREAAGYDVGVYPVGIALGHLNGDQHLDLAAANGDQSSVSVLMGDGSGGFGPRTIVPVGLEAYGVAIGDLNGDGYGDLAALSYTGLSVLLGHGDGTFGLSAGDPGRYSTVDIADLNRDGQMDLVLGYLGGSAVSVMLGDGGGGFQPRIDAPIGQVPRRLTMGDLNGDENVDLVVVTDGSYLALLGDGLGGFVVTAEGPAGPGQPAIGDVDGDGAADVALTMGQSLVGLLPGAQDGTFGAPVLLGTGGLQPLWVGIEDRNGDDRPDLTVTNGGIMESSYPEGVSYGGIGASVSVLYQTSPPPPGSAPQAPKPTFVGPAFWHPDTIVLGQTFKATFSVRNDGLTSDDGRLSVSFPSFTDPLDGQWVSAAASGDVPGYAETAAGGSLLDNACNVTNAAYLASEYGDADWKGQSIEGNTMTLTVQPRTAGPFHMYVRGTMHKAGGAPCEFVNGLPVVGEESFVDQQGWPVKRLTVMVSPPPPAPEPRFIGTIAPVPEWIGLGQSFTVKVVARNMGAASDDGRIVVGFPAFTTPADSQQVTSFSDGDSPGYQEIAAGAATSDSSCLTAVTPHLMVEYADADWPWLGSETDTLTVTVRPTELGTFYFDVRSTMHMAGGAPCQVANAWPAGAGAAITDPLGWTVRRYAVTVVPAPPQPAFVSDVVLDPPAIVTLGGTFTLTATATNSGPGSNDGRISVSFPNLTAASDGQWVSAASGDDLPGYREFPAGASIQRKDCSSMTANALTVEYADDGWSGAEAESNTLVLTVQPRATGTFNVYVRSTMGWNEALQCTYINGVPGNGTASTDQQGWAVRQFQVQVVPPAPAPVFVAPITGIPAAMVLGESFRFTAIVKNNGPLSDDGRITVGFPTLTQAGDSVWVTSGSIGDQPGYVERYPGSLIPDTQCNLLPAGYLVAEYADSAWATGETDTLSITVQPPATGTFYIDVRSTLRDVGDTRGNCGYVVGHPPNTTNGMIDQQGWLVARFTVVVNGPSGTLPPPTASWQQIVAPPGGPSPRAGAGAVFHPGRDAIVLYGGVDPLCRDDVWSFPLAPGGGWSAITPGGTLPQRRSMHSMIYDAFDDQLVIFGGYYSGFMNDVTLMTFAEQPLWFPNSGHGTPPRARGGHAAVYDPVRNRMLVIGGWGDALLNDVWEYGPAGNGTWRQLAPLGTPMQGRVQHVAVYDPVRDRVLVIGGDGGAFLNDVWALNLTGEPAWERLTPDGTPPSPRREHAAIYDPVGDRIILHGGFDGARRGDLWSLSLGGTPSWTLLASSTASPANRSGHAAIYDAPRRRMVVFGGEVGPQAYSGEVWALNLDTTTPIAVSLAGTDVNADRVKLTWSGEGLASLRSAVFRSTAVNGEWIEIGSPTVEGDDRFVFEDRTVVPGTEYGYRLVVWQGAEETTLDPVWVTVPRRAILDLAGASPNPSPRGVMVRFSLPGDHPATLELFDLKGRRIALREVGSLGAGDHLVSLSDRPDLPAGIYLVRLTQDQRALTAKACIVK